MCFKDSTYHYSCRHYSHFFRTCGDRCCPTYSSTIPTRLVDGETTYDGDTGCRRCRIESMVTSTPHDPELPGLINLQEQDDAQMQLTVNTWDRERRRQVQQGEGEELTEEERQLLYGDPCGWYSERARAWIAELAGQGVTYVAELYSNGIFDSVQQEIIFREELELYPRAREEMEAFRRDQRDGLETFLRKQREQLDHFRRARQDPECGQEEMDKFQHEQKAEMEEFKCRQRWDVEAARTELLQERYELQRQKAVTDAFRREQQEALERFECDWEKELHAIQRDMQRLWQELPERPSEPGQASDTANNTATIEDVLQRETVIQAQLEDLRRRYLEELERFQEEQREGFNDFLEPKNITMKLG